MATFNSWRSFWTFQHEAGRKRRFVYTTTTKEFLVAVAATCGKRAKDIPLGWIGWRAQIGYDWRTVRDGAEIQCAYPPLRMKPMTDRACEGRANPKGIPCLYLATTLQTAVSEVRPWAGALVSAGQFRTNRPLRIMDCSVNHARQPLFLSEPSVEKREEAVWSHIDRAFSEPVTQSDNTAEYAATQILAELFQDLQYDGVAYKSVFGDDGYNIALFDLSATDLLNCGLYKVDTAVYKFSQEDAIYSVK